MPTRIPRVAGFTLVELMVVIVIATILITIAVPSYQRSIRHAHRTDARTALLDLAQREERYASTNSSYTTDSTKLGYGSAFPVNVGSNYYQLSVCVSDTLPCTGAAATGSAFLLTATAINTQAKDTECLKFYVDSRGTQTATSTTCWN